MEEVEWLRAQWEYYDVRPYHDESTLIGDKTFTVPYNGEKHKPTVLEVHGKKQFDFYAYTFRIPGRDEKTPFGIMWDVETGMVRTYSIYRSLGYEKSAPAETFKMTPGLPDLAVNITGGKIDIQGFWIPYDAALELCARFAYDLRAVLYPMFGPAILRRAIAEGRPSFKDWVLPTALVTQCRDSLPVARLSAPPSRADTPMRTPRRSGRSAVVNDDEQSSASSSLVSSAASSSPASPLLRQSGKGKRRSCSPAQSDPSKSPRTMTPGQLTLHLPGPLTRMSAYEMREQEAATAILLLAQKERLGRSVENPHLRPW
ncbi:hypothetical protein K461DRAFT_296846 [Myriangium duriaei CBS 260.36]|uniref:HTH APSES-type domain-containing protein n=1 Tax=Myriangium duriaei CBS 260.36 TaxID=1168546 RepID=A0A9P4IX00_9PEZI|nr:hypothetical protein K461DRAFT_296846 [Myriangium duriaei CBS 260.36]